MQSFLFSFSVLNLLSAIILILGLTQAAQITSNKYLKIGMGIIFILINACKFSDQVHYIH
jgi:hypothetical protein